MRDSKILKLAHIATGLAICLSMPLSASTAITTISGTIKYATASPYYLGSSGLDKEYRDTTFAWQFGGYVKPESPLFRIGRIQNGISYYADQSRITIGPDSYRAYSNIQNYENSYMSLTGTQPGWTSSYTYSSAYVNIQGADPADFGTKSFTLPEMPILILTQISYTNASPYFYTVGRVYSSNRLYDLALLGLSGSLKNEVYSKQQMAQKAIDLAKKYSKTDIDLSRDAYRQSILIRERLYEGSSTNPELRDVEYFLRGYSGGLMRENLSSIGKDGDVLNDIFNAIIPQSAPSYVWLKSIGLIGQENELPASDAGGGDIAVRGWNAARRGYSIEEALLFIDTPLPPSDESATPTGSTDDPLTPDNSLTLEYSYPGSSGPASLSIHFFDILVEAGEMYWFDPIIESRFSLVLNGLFVDQFSIRPLGGGTCSGYVQIGVSNYFDLACGQTMNLDDLGILPTDYLSFYGYEFGDRPAVFGLRFAQGGAGALTIMSARIPLETEMEPGAIPEPSVWLSMILGFGCVGFVARQRVRPRQPNFRN